MRSVGTLRFGAVRRIALLVALAALVATAGWVASGYLDVGEVRVPDVEGLVYETAAARLRSAGLEPQAYVEVDPRAAGNEVVSQSPLAGQVVRPGRRVAVGVNGFAEAASMPTLVGLREAEAIARSEAVGAAVAWVTYVGGERPAGTVLAQQPAAGSFLAPAATVHLTVSRGPVDTPVVLPELVGQPIEAAAAQLEALGIRHVARVAADVSFDRPFSVTEQRPAAGASVLPSTPVTLVFALEGTRVVAVPDLTGLPLWRAQLALRAAQLVLGPVQRIVDPGRPDGVVSTRPGAYTLVGAPVAVVVNDAGGATPDFDAERPPLPGGVTLPPLPVVDVDDTAITGPVDPPVDDVPAPGTTVAQTDGSRLIPFRFDPAMVGVARLTREPYRLTLVVSDDEGDRTVLERDLAAGEAISVSVRVVGDAPLIQTFIDGAFFQAWRP